MAALTTVQPNHITGFSPDLLAAMVAASGGGDTFDNNNGLTLFYVYNGGGSDITVTFEFNSNAPSLVDGAVPPNYTETVAAGKLQRFGPFDSTLYADADDNVAVSYSAVTSVTVMPALPGN